MCACQLTPNSATNWNSIFEYRKTKLVQNVEIKNAWDLPRKRCLSGNLILLSNRITGQKRWALETSKSGVLTVYPITIYSIFPQMIFWSVFCKQAAFWTSSRCHFLDQSRSCKWRVLTPQGKIKSKLSAVCLILSYIYRFPLLKISRFKDSRL